MKRITPPLIAVIVISLLIMLTLSECNKEELQLEDDAQTSSQEDILKSPFSNPQNKTEMAIDFLNNYLENDQIAYAPNANKQSQAYQVPKKYSSQKIDTTYDIDLKGKKMLRLIIFKPSGYILISTIKDVPNPPVLFFDGGKFDEKNPNPGLLAYMEQFLRTAATEYTKTDAAPPPTTPSGGSRSSGGSPTPPSSPAPSGGKHHAYKKSVAYTTVTSTGKNESRNGWQHN